MRAGRGVGTENAGGGGVVGAVEKVAGGQAHEGKAKIKTEGFLPFRERYGGPDGR